MTRVEFTHNIVNLLSAMMLDGEHPIGDFWKRSDEEQMRLFIKGASNCDGVTNISQHQIGKALDIYFIDLNTNQLCNPKRGWEYWHDYWETKGGRALIYLGPNKTKPDYAHFEG